MIELEIPSDLGYGERGQSPAIPGNATLHFILELIKVGEDVKPVDHKHEGPDHPFGEASPPEDDKVPEGFTATASGLKYRVTKESQGRKPNAANTVKVHYRGKLTNGTVFDESYKRGAPTEFPLSGVIPGWTEGLQLVGEGGTIELIIPGRLGYPNGQPPQIPPNATLHFTVELLEVK
ncbi:MAG: FKBP-type peptidyl-prolyl cis-trans isomerase [Candidatus Saccharimonas sp.]|nr:FKBP-type peptidyl-prolyl cis-trans isomerase [Planctomycetaceae bacterium]